MEIENGQNETEGVMFIDFTQHALWIAVKLLAVSTDRSQEYIYTYIYVKQEIHTHTHV